MKVEKHNTKKILERFFYPAIIEPHEKGFLIKYGLPGRVRASLITFQSLNLDDFFKFLELERERMVEDYLRELKKVDNSD